MESEQEVEGLVKRVVYRAADGIFAVVRLDVADREQPVTVVGALGELRDGEYVVVTGRWEKHAAHGEQLRATRAVAAPPRTEAGVRRYLEGLPGLGAALAERLVGSFGVAAIEVLEGEAWRAAQVKGVGKARAERAGRAAVERKREREVMVFLQGLGVSRAYAARIRKAYGDDAIARVRDNPYRLARDVDGIGFLVADRIARGMGVQPDAPERREAAMLHALQTFADDGHARMTRVPLFARVELLLGGESQPVDVDASGRAIERLALEGAVVREGEAVYLSRLHKAEVGLASRILALRDAERRAAPTIGDDVPLSDGQRAALDSLGRSGVAVLTGGPGTGKTTVTRALVHAWEAEGRRVLLAAPTGRAARRLSEATQREALTLHRLLEWGRGSGRGGFQRDSANPLEADLIVVDEASMIDLLLARALVDACPLGVTLVWVGDVDQLPSVGPGQVLADLICSGAVPVARLTEVFRQAEGSGIVDAAYRVLAGEVPVSRPAPDGGTSDFYVIEVERAEEAEDRVLRLVRERIPRAFELDPLRDVQVLAPMHRGTAGTARLNAALAQALSGKRDPLELGGRDREDRPRALHVGDKVMQVRNDYDRDVFNGDIGFISGPLRDADGDVTGLVVDFDGRAVEYDGESSSALELAYCVSIHKSQGSEYPAVVVTLVAGHHLMLRRNLLYTAITRARSLVVLVVEPRALRRAVENEGDVDRRSGLRERLSRGDAMIGSV
ncbi:MAG: ATP-dependent RecD-like DNA helicase [Polyangia bacterium]